MVGSTYITVPDPKADVGSLSAAVYAIKHNINQLIVNSNTLNQKSLTGAKVFALQDNLNSLSAMVNGAIGQFTAANSSINNHNSSINIINESIASIQKSLSVLQSRLPPPSSVANLPDPTTNLGAIGLALDATMTLIAGIGTVVVGGSTNIVPVFSDGTNWIIG